MDFKKCEVNITSERLCPKDKHVLLEIKNGKATYYSIDSKEFKTIDITDHDIENFFKVVDAIKFFDLPDETYGVNLSIGEGRMDEPMAEWVSVYDGVKRKTIVALFCGAGTPAKYDTMVWEAIRFGQAKAGHSFFA